MRRKEKLVNGEIYHIFNKSIADFKIFNNNNDFSRMKDMIRYYQAEGMPLKFSQYMELVKVKRNGFLNQFKSDSQDKERIVQIIAFCFMPTHYHLILKQLRENGISVFISNIQNSYTRYFNTKFKRKGPLWEGPFKNVLIKTDTQLLHLTRYLHLNSVTSYLVNRPEEWLYTSYLEYLSKIKENEKICDYEDLLDIEPSYYKKFIEDRISYQRELSRIKELLFE